MNNAEFYKYSDAILVAFGKWCEARRAEKTLDSLALFCSRPASTALVYEIGEIVSVTFGGKPRYAKVSGYNSESGFSNALDLTKIEYRFTDESNHGCAVEVSEECPDAYRTRIPQELLDLAKAEVRAELLKSIKCPLAETRDGGEGVAE